MKITLYKSTLCPRCRLAEKHLRELLLGSSHELEVVDILSNPKKSWQKGIRMIPAIAAGKRRVSGILLSRSDINEFLEELDQEHSDRA